MADASPQPALSLDISGFALAVTECQSKETLGRLFGRPERVEDREIGRLIDQFHSPETQKSRFDAERAALHLATIAPDNSDVKYLVITWYSNANNVDARRYQSVLDALNKPKSVRTANRLGQSLRKAGMPVQAHLSFRRALTIDQTDADALRNLAALLRDEKHYEAGLICIDYLLDHHPLDAWAHVQKGNLLARMQAHKPAADSYRYALQLDTSLPGIRTALARQYRFVNDYPPAIATLIEALHDDPKDQRALEGLAEAYRVTGQHENAMIWYQRALNGRENSRSLKQALAVSYRVNEFWQAARQVVSTSANQSAGIEWSKDQKPIQLVMTDDELDLKSLIGLAMARELAAAGVSVTCVLPAWAQVLIKDIPASLHLLSDRPAGFSVDALPLGELLIYCGFPARVCAPWIAEARAAKAVRKKSFAFVTGTSQTLPWPDMDRVREVLAPGLTQQIIHTRARPTFGRTFNYLKKVNFVVTDDPMTALVAASIGCPSIFFVPCDCDWWWANRGQSSPYSAVQTILRIPPDVNARSLMEVVSAAIKRQGKPLEAPKPLRLAKPYPDLQKEILRISKHFEPRNTDVLPVETLTGGTRNTMFKVGGDDNPRVYRLSRFPPPRKHFYQKEMVNMTIAAQAGLAPRVDFSDSLDGSLLIEYIDGETMRSRSIRKKENAVSVAQIFRRLHCLPGFKDKFDIYKKVKRNTDFLLRSKSQGFLKRAVFNELMSRTMDMLDGHRVPHYATHNDPLTRNFVRHGDRMMLIDWECSGIGDPHWDVAAMSAQAGLDEDVWHAYLVAYFGREHHPSMCRIPLLEALCRYYWWTEALYTGARNPDDPSWQAAAERWSGWFIEIVLSNGFKMALRTAKNYQWEPSHSPAAVFDA